MASQNIFNVPNSFILAIITLFTSIWGVSITFIQYLKVPQFGRYDHENAEKILSRGTLLLMRKASAITMILTFPLVARSTTSLYNDTFLHENSLNKGVWCLIRLMLQLSVGGSVFLFDSDSSFRYFTCFGLSCLVVINMISEMNLVYEINCIKSGLCTNSQFGGWSLASLHFFVFRDLITISLCLFNIILSFWIFPVIGMWRNKFFLPRREHREFSKLNGF